MSTVEIVVAVLTLIEGVFMVFVGWKWWQARQFDTEHLEMSHDYIYNPKDDMTPQEAVVLGRAFSTYGEYISKNHLSLMQNWAKKKYGINVARHYKKSKLKK